RVQQRRRQHLAGARRLRSADQEICRPRGRREGADRPGPGRQEDVGQGQEGRAGRPQRSPEIAAARGREQGQHRYRDQELRQADGRVRRQRRQLSRSRPNRTEKRAPENFSGAFLMRNGFGAATRVHPHPETIKREPGDPARGRRIDAEGLIRYPCDGLRALRRSATQAVRDGSSRTWPTRKSWSPAPPAWS
ncbi:hypothetical protein chiPu_0032572, partial [Chiloscyllium punctatum]|nr:hypothetical protein [Chiloscyllium punctatum]